VLGPFWSPEVAIPGDVPSALGRGLLLHASTEVVAEDVHTSAHRDPWRSSPAEHAPDGYGIFRERRFAAGGAALDAARGWVGAHGARALVVPIGGHRP